MRRERAGGSGWRDGVRYRVNGSRFTVHGSRFTIHGSRFKVHVSPFSSWFMLHGSRFTVHDSRFMIHGSLRERERERGRREVRRGRVGEGAEGR